MSGSGGDLAGGADVVTIIPRWEWRVFGQGFVAAENILAGSTPGPAEESDELYLLFPAAAIVKIRYDLLDIKLLREIDPDGLERWEPVAKLGFPLPAAEVSTVFDTLCAAPPSLSRDAYTLDQFLAVLAESSSVVRPVKVHKRRVRYALGGLQGRDRRRRDGRPDHAHHRDRVGGPVRPHCRRPRRSASTPTPIPVIRRDLPRSSTPDLHATR